ncbi:hypothetical protein CANINC_004854 [Pichia inconspicua]|uniref:Uncharacterized protein n=1 Tax=Pichia inconspicua TaxID=52247 RepID=A0A4T0WUX9_9ASCO|nr:hypothetical protein CANINC_004854 [[Candida] inconspicua]
METDYYSEYLPADAEESEVYEIEPKTCNETTLSVEEINIKDYPNVIEEDNRDKLRTLNSEFEEKIKHRLLYSRNRKHSNDNKALRFKLLENELRSLMVDIQEEAQEDNSQLKQRVDSLIDEIETFKTKQNKDTFTSYWTQKLDELKIDSSIVESINDLNITELHTTNCKLTEIEARLALLEKQLGICGTELDQMNLSNILEDLRLKVNIILDGGKSIERIRSEIDQLNKNCQVYLDNSKKITNKSEILPLTDSKLSLLYNKIKQLPDLDKKLNTIAIRLKSLDEITLQTTHNAEFVSGLNKELNRIDNKLDLWEQKLSDLEVQLDTDRIAFTELKRA